MKKQQKKDDTKTLLVKIETLQEELEASKNRELRAIADLQNVQRRETENKIHWSRDAVCDFLVPLLPKINELEMGKNHTTDKDIQKTIEHFLGTLRKLGLEKINPEKDTPIDTDQHDVLMTGEGNTGCVVQVLEPGWKFGDRVITPAKVSAGQG